MTFAPGKVRPGHFEFKIGTAGSTTLVLQTVLPALLLANAPSDLVLEGGTHNPFAPPFDFLASSFLPLINRMGPSVHAHLERPGFYPAGGGRFTVAVQPAPQGVLAPFDLLDAGEAHRRVARALVAGLPRSIAEREVKLLGRKLGWSADALRVECAPESCGPGNLVVAELHYQHHVAVFTGFGQKGITAEAVAEHVVTGVRRFMAARVPVCEHLADQLMIPLALARGGSYATMPLSRHAQTNRQIIARFLDVRIEEEPAGEHKTIVHFQ